MASFNSVILLGNLTRDPELKYTPKGTAVAQIGIAINHHYTRENGEKVEDTTFVDIDLFGRTAEIANEYLRKGNPVLIQGRLKLDTWDDKTSGQKRSKLKVIGDSMQLLGGKRDGDSDQEERKPQQRPAGGRSPAPPAKRPPPPLDPDLDGGDSSEIPF